MTSRDGSNRSNRPIRNADAQSRVPRQGNQWELDAEDLNRYMSGQPSRQPRFDPYGRSQSTGRTERIPARPTREPQPEPQYEEYDAYEEETWQGDEYADEFQDTGYQDQAYDESDYVEPAPEPTRARQQVRQPRQQTRARTQEPEYYDEDLYEDPYVLDDEETPARRAPQRAPRPRKPRQSQGFALPPALTNSPVIADRTTLGMIAVLVVSTIAMIIVVATKRDELPAIFTHVNANGEPENISGVGAAWRMPLIGGMVMLINLVLAWFLARWGMFLPRFLLGGSIAVHFIVWVALLAYFF